MFLCVPFIPSIFVSKMENIAFDSIDFSEEITSCSSNDEKSSIESTDENSLASNNKSIIPESVNNSNILNQSLDDEEKIRIDKIYNPSELVILY